MLFGTLPLGFGIPIWRTFPPWPDRLEDGIAIFRLRE